MIGKKINELATELAPLSTDLTIIGDPTTGVSKKITLEQISSLFGGSVSFYTNLAGFPAVGNIDIIYCAKDTNKLYLWSGSAYTEIFPSQALLDTYQLRSEKGNANGYASLDSGGKVPISQLPSSIMEYKGTWNATTNTPTLANGTGDTGDVYICNVAGTVNFGAGPLTFAVGDYVIYSGTIWQRSSGAVGTVTSVAVSRSGDALAITGSPVTTSGTINIGFAGNSTQYINGAGNLVTFPGVINEAQNLITEVYNKTGATLTKGTVVYINGGQGNLPTITKALATGDSTSAQTYGIVRNDITNNNNGYVVVAGRISDLDTQAYTEGTQLYLSPTTAGTFTSTKPYAPQHLVYVGIVVRAHPTQGVIEVKIQNGYEMDELHNVAAQSPDNNDILQYKTATSLWTKVAGNTTNIAEGTNLYYTDARSRAALSFTAGSGAYNSTTGVITIPTNTNQLTNGANYITLASLSAGAGISYNNTTGVITSTITQYTDANARAAISLTTSGTSGAATYNSTTGVLNVPQYAPDLSGYVPTSRTLTINGTAYDLSANRSWSVGTVTSVGLSSATSGVTIGSTPITTNGTITLAIATASGSQQGLLSSTDWTTFNNKQNALTNPVTGSGTTNYLPKFTGTSTIGDSILYEAFSGVVVGGPIYAADGTSTSASIRFLNANSGLYSAPSDALGFITSGTEKMRLNASGNLGLGVTPSAWESGFNAIEVDNVGNAIFGRGGSDMRILSNAYYDGAYKYAVNGAASTYQQTDGKHIWFQAGSGTAGNAISFTQAMTLNASGNLSIGNTNDTYKLDVSGTGRFAASYTASGSVAIETWQRAGGAVSADMTYNDANTSMNFGTSTSHTLNIKTNNTTALSIASTQAATFSSSVKSTQFQLTNSSGQYYYFDNATGNNFIGLTATNTLGLYVGGNLSLSIASTGAATFSSSVTATNVILSATGYLGFGGGTNYIEGDNANNIIRIGTNNTTKVTINGSGNVGIGTTAPDMLLSIRGSDSTAVSSSTFWNFSFKGAELSNLSNTVNTVTGLALTGGSNRTSISAIANILESASLGALAFFTGGSGVSNTAPERMRITSGGNVGIGTTSPSEKLHVTGYGFFSGVNQGVLLGEGNCTIVGDSATTNAANMIFYTANNERMRITNGGNVEINTGSIKTGEPDTGWGRSAIKIGARVSGTAFGVGGYLPVSVDGTVYYINLNSSTP
jgi:hypothetical protein